MGTRPKPTEHMATSEDETPDRYQVAESARDAPVPQSVRPQPQQTEYSEQPSTSTLHQIQITSAEMTAGAVPVLPQKFTYLPAAARIRVSTDLYSKPSTSTAVNPLDQPGPSGLQKSKSFSPGTKKTSRSKTVLCEICQKSFLNVSKLQNHLKTVHSNVPQEEASSAESTSAQFLCEHCNKNFSSKFKLVRHVLIHSDRRQFSCTVCERTFHRKDHLKNHIKVHSPTKKIYTCDRGHCQKEYTSALSFKKHLAIHFAEEGELDCKICSKRFDTKQDILYHLKIHAGSRTIKNPNEKKFRCDYCERKFFTRKDVRRHLVVHTGRRDFLCQFCPQRFGRKDHLVRHIKKSHSTENLLVVKRSTDIEQLKVEPSYEMGPSTSGAGTSSYFPEEAKVIKSEESIPQQYPVSTRLLPSRSRYTTTEHIKIEQVKMEAFEMLSETTTKPTSFYSKILKTEEAIPQQPYTTSTLMPSTSYATEESHHLMAPDFSIETENPSFIQHSDTSIYSEAAENLFQSAAFATLNPLLTAGGGLLLEQQSSPMTIDLGHQAATEAVLSEQEYQNILQTDNPVLHNPDLLDLISESDLMMSSNDEDSKPLPGFSQAFQNQPPPKE